MLKMKNQQNNICKCGHSKDDHDNNGRDYAWYGVCCVPMVRPKGERPFCYHEEFKLDNLRYLESCYEKETTEA